MDGVKVGDLLQQLYRDELPDSQRDVLEGALRRARFTAENPGLDAFRKSDGQPTWNPEAILAALEAELGSVTA